MTTSGGRLLAACVGGFACSERVLHNRLKAERDYCGFEPTMKFVSLVMEPLHSERWETVTRLFLLHLRPHIGVLHHCCGSCCSRKAHSP